MLFPVNLAVLLERNAEVSAGLGNVDLVTLHGRMVAVVAMVRDPPTEERSPKKGVRDLEKPMIRIGANRS